MRHILVVEKVGGEGAWMRPPLPVNNLTEAKQIAKSTWISPDCVWVVYVCEELVTIDRTEA